MHLSAILSLAGAASVATAAAVDARIPRMGAFSASLTMGCPLANLDSGINEFAIGSQGDTCRTFYDNATYQSIHVYYWIPQCLLTVYNTADCSDPGIVSGTGCWSPPGGVAGYKITCPYL
ncbi:hypothetical protein N658DRAFT_494957 [Parathielavia hyrcaniae]|uniref:Uncharacterized protein n=1 Tax=Parathielavia hyrcaniae TaxID=113614 RepID=A0AAN6Q3L5_9PEZI|nr:hypothetical protein N658DRAFT_494957 [Parathielavia hyrcaniae]